MKIDLVKIVQSPHQVRAVPDDKELWELAESIGDNGLLQPVKVRPMGEGYELVYGHRRVAAMRLLGWDQCEAIIEEVTDQDSLVQSLVENLQRQNLDILDEAVSYRTLVERGYTLSKIAELVKKPQGRISNRLSILRLPVEIQQLVMPRRGQHATTTEQGGLSPDSASRIASSAKTPREAIALARKAVDERLDSGEVRELTRRLSTVSDPAKRSQIIRDAGQMVAGRDVRRGRDDRSAVGFALPPSESYSELVHKRITWNIRRLDIERFGHFTIGYSGRSLGQFVELLQLARVDLVADVRRIPISRFRPEFSKSNLDTAMRKHGIAYVHWPDLGIPTEIRRSLNKEELFAWYDASLQPETQLQQHEAELSSHRTAFMCVEVAPQSCHRHRIAAHLERMGYRVLDL